MRGISKRTVYGEIRACLVAGTIIPVGKAETAAQSGGTSVMRAVSTEVGKEALSLGTGYASDKIVTKVTGSDEVGMLAGIATSIFTYGGLNKLDTSLNVSGINRLESTLNQSEFKVIDDVKGASGATLDKVKDIANQVKKNNGSPPKGYKGGKTYKNEPINGGQKLPEGVNYREYDINPHVKGQNRGPERIVMGDDGSVWYTNDHYHTFTKIN